VTRRGRYHGTRLALIASALGLLTLVAPGAASAGDAGIKLALRPIGQAGTYFDLTMRPGERRRLEVEIANVGTQRIAARSYAADVYTIVNGGFGGRLRDEPQTGTTSRSAVMGSSPSARSSDRPSPWSSPSRVSPCRRS
jgi:hypothetical protein